MKKEFRWQRQAYAWIVAALPLVVPASLWTTASWKAGLLLSGAATSAALVGKTVLFPRRKLGP
jgi:hypothetical protein